MSKKTKLVAVGVVVAFAGLLVCIDLINGSLKFGPKSTPPSVDQSARIVLSIKLVYLNHSGKNRFKVRVRNVGEGNYARFNLSAWDHGQPLGSDIGVVSASDGAYQPITSTTLAEWRVPLKPAQAKTFVFTTKANGADNYCARGLYVHREELDKCIYNRSG